MRTEEINSLVDKGLMSSPDEWHEITALASQLLPRGCNDRCKRMTDSGQLVCKKSHPVKDSPDPTSHQYVPMPYNFSQNCLDALTDANLCTVDANGKVEFSHPYFEPTKHMPPCNSNATCNMSPVVCELFLLCRSMVNVQYMAHAGAIAKYVLKYVSKFD